MTTLVKLTVGGTDYYLSDTGYNGSEFFYPFLVAPPRISFEGSEYIQVKAGDLQLHNLPEDSNHPFSYASGNFSSLLSDPYTEYSVVINHNRENFSTGKSLWEGKAVFSSISKSTITFRLFSERAVSGNFGFKTLCGRMPFYFVSATNPCYIHLYTGTSTPDPSIYLDNFKPGEYVIYGYDIDTGQPNGGRIDGFLPVQEYKVLSVTYLGSGYTGRRVQITIDLDRTAYSDTFCKIYLDGSTLYSGNPNGYFTKAVTQGFAFLTDSSLIKEVDENTKLWTAYDGYQYIQLPQNVNSSNATIYENGVAQTVTQGTFSGVGANAYRKSSGDAWDGLLTFQVDSAIYPTVADVGGLLLTVDQTKAINANDEELASLDFYKDAVQNKIDTFSEICKNSNHQFYFGTLPILSSTIFTDTTITESSSFITSPVTLEANLTLGSGQAYEITATLAGAAEERLFLIDKANAPTASAISQNLIASVSYSTNFPTKNTTADLTRFFGVGTAGTDGYNLQRIRETLNVYDSSVNEGNEIKLNQISDKTDVMEDYMTAMLEEANKLQITLTLQGIQRDYTFGDALTFTEISAPVTVSSLIIREISYNLDTETTTFKGVGTVTKRELT